MTRSRISKRILDSTSDEVRTSVQKIAGETISVKMTKEEQAEAWANENGDVTKHYDWDISKNAFLAGWEACEKRAGCEFEAQNNPKIWVLYAGFWYEVSDFSNEFGVQWVHIYDEPPSKHVDRVKLSSTTGIKISNERPPKPQELSWTP